MLDKAGALELLRRMLAAADRRVSTEISGRIHGLSSGLVYATRMRFVVAALLVAASAAVVLVTTRSSSDAAEPAQAPSTQRIGKPFALHAGPAVTAARLKRLLKRPPKHQAGQPPEFDEGSSSVRRPAGVDLASSPKPVNSWPAGPGANPPDPQIAASSTDVVVGNNGVVLFFTKAGKPYPSGANSLILTNLFQPLIDKNSATGPKLGKPENGRINNFNDSKTIFDPYRRRFVIVATGTCRGQETAYVDKNANGLQDKSEKTLDVAGPSKRPPDGILDGNDTRTCALNLPTTKRRSVIGLAVSAGEDPAGCLAAGTRPPCAGTSTGGTPRPDGGPARPRTFRAISPTTRAWASTRSRST